MSEWISGPRGAGRLVEILTPHGTRRGARLDAANVGDSERGPRRPDPWGKARDARRAPLGATDGTRPQGATPMTSHIHSIERCEHELVFNCDEVHWLCGFRPKWTHSSTAWAEGDDLADHDANEQAWAREPDADLQNIAADWLQFLAEQVRG